MSNTDTEQRTLPEREQAILDTALLESDQLLARSLHDDQRRRQRRRWLLVTAFGGVVMSSILLAVWMGWASLGQVQTPGDSNTTVEQSEQAESLAVEGWKLWQGRNYTKAAEKFTAAVKIDPRLTNAWNGLGWSQFNGGESEKAVAAFEKCVALEPKHPVALNGLGQIYLMWKEYDRAEKYLLIAAPQNPASWYGLARLYLLQGKFAKAKPWVEKLAAQGSDDESTKQMLAAVEAGKLSDELRRQIEPAGKPSPAAADNARGWSMFQQSKYSTAERLFRRALKADPENLAALNGLAFCLLNQGNHEQAQPLFEQYLAKQKDAPGPMNGLARCLKASGKADEAVELWEKMAEKYPGPTAAAYGLASTYMERKEYEKAVKYYQILADSNASNKEYKAGLKQAKAKLAKQSK